MDHEIAFWVSSRIDSLLPGPYRSIGVICDNGIVAGFVFHGFVGHEIQCSMASDHPGWWSRDKLRFLFGYPFNQLGVRRITLTVARSNDKSLRLTRKLGFKVEGILRDGAPDGSDMVVLGMLKSECRWI
jgi:hypothetical protein